MRLDVAEVAKATSAASGPNVSAARVEARVRLCTMVGGLPEYPRDIRGSATKDEERPGAGRYGLVRGECLCVAVA